MKTLKAACLTGCEKLLGSVGRKQVKRASSFPMTWNRLTTAALLDTFLVPGTVDEARFAPPPPPATWCLVLLVVPPLDSTNLRSKVIPCLYIP